MTEFEKWWDIFVNKHCETCMKNDWVNDRDTARKHIEKYKHYYKRGYKAALRWTLSIDDGFCNCGAMNVDEHSSTYEKIENELKNLNQENEE